LLEDLVASQLAGDTRAVRLGVGGTALWRLPRFRDHRGSLVVAELPEDLPFPPRRIFAVYDVPGADVRGEHAHRECEQLLVATHGALSVRVDDGSESREVRLDVPSVALYLPPMIWGVQHRFSEDAVLLVLASHAYDADDYIRDRDEFVRIVAKARPRP
jgi:DNA-binding transcriptional LysR family regulator